MFTLKLKTKHHIIVITIISILIIIYLITNSKSKKKIVLRAINKDIILNYNDIFPLKKYKFYNFELYGPNTYKYFNEFYGAEYMKKASRKYDKEKPFKIKNFLPASLKINKRNKGCTKKTKRCIFWSKKNYMIPPCCANHLTEILYKTSKILEKNNIDYFIYWGSLLGSIRHGGIIPWDTDADIYILDKDIYKLISIKTEFEKEGFQFITENNHFFRINYSNVNKLHLDIFTCYDSK